VGGGLGKVNCTSLAITGISFISKFLDMVLPILLCFLLARALAADLLYGIVLSENTVLYVCTSIYSVCYIHLRCLLLTSVSSSRLD